jgi:predicted transcriptional regulator
MRKGAKIKVGIANEQTINKEFINAWKRAERNEIKEPEERLYFLEAKTLLRVLSEKRLALLQILHHSGKVSIKALSRILSRNYRNVYDDVRILRDAGLIQQNDSKEIYVPWDRIQAEIDLAA